VLIGHAQSHMSINQPRGDEVICLWLSWTASFHFFYIESLAKFRKKLAELMKFTLERRKSLPISLTKIAKFSQRKNAPLQRLLIVPDGCEKIEKNRLNTLHFSGVFMCTRALQLRGKCACLGSNSRPRRHARAQGSSYCTDPAQGKTRLTS
jgi:hypothetical protein